MKESMKRALEALEGIHPGNMTPMAEEYWSKAITALREALAEQPAPVQHRSTGWAAHRDQYAVPVLFNPYTGEPRDVRDVQSDPQGILIVPPGKVEMLAAAPQPAQQEPVAHCEAGPEYCQQCYKESVPTYGSEEVRKLREVIESQAKIIALMEKNQGCPPFWPVVQHLLDEYGLQLIDIVASYKQATEQPAQQEWIETACALIKAADDAAHDSDYMLDSNDCIKVLRGEWKGHLMNDQPTAPQPAPVQQQPMVLNAAMGYIMRHTPKLVHDEICKALRRPVTGASPQPAQRKPLTIREIGAVCGNFSNETIKVVRQIEAKHGIKGDA